ncbi:MAG: S-layer homology domain-containing protein, partial [Clostridia bacterium]
IKNMVTGRVSETAYAVYIAEEDHVLGGAVSIQSPFDKKRISAHLLGKGDYANGILFTPTENVMYRYRYTFTPEAGGGSYESDNIRFEPKNALIPTEKMDTVTVNAWIDGEKQTTEINHTIDIVQLDIPKVNVSANPDESGSYSKGTKYWVENIYPSDENIIVYYTTDGSNPAKSASRKNFTLADKGTEETLSKTTTVKTVYYSACGDAGCEACQSGNFESCPNSVYGAVGTYIYTVPEIKYAGGGGGSRVVDNTRKYTKDVFGNQHLTHIGYINGYPDGSVQPEGKITREEMAAILYRIKNKQYDEPLSVKGDVFSDVPASRWSVSEIEYMAKDNVIGGYPNGEFKPSKNLSRAEFAALIRRFAGLEKADAENRFSDLSESHWAYEDMMSLYGAGMLSGYEDGTIRPENETTRAEVMKVLNKLLGRNPSEPYVKSLGYNPFNDLETDTWYYVIVLEATVTHNYYLDDKGVESKWEDCK